MLRIIAPVACAGLFIAGLVHAEGPPQLESTIESVGLFKNGLAVVRRSITLPVSEGSVFDITDLPEPVHGTFWVESTAQLEISVTHADVPAKDDAPLPNMTNDALKGSTVTVYFKSEHLPAISGRVATPPEPIRTWNKNYSYARPTHQWWWSGFNNNYVNNNNNVGPANPAPLVLDTDTGEVVLDVATIAYVRVDARSEMPTVRRPVLRVRVEDEPNDDIEVGILYLTKGASWAPSYEVELQDSSSLMLRQSAVIRNELEDWRDVELLLITGFPSIEFGHVLSPMSPATDLASFFRALGTQTKLSHASRGDVLSQAVAYNASAPGLDATAASVSEPTLAGDDLQYHSIGRRMLLAGDSMIVQTAEAGSSAESIVQWIVPDDRDQWGRRVERWSGYGMVTNDEPAEPWDAVRFRNPLDRAMTTAPAMIVKGGQVRGQGMVHWSAPGEQVVLPINKTLSVRAWVNEVEAESSRVEVRRYGRVFWRSTVEGEFSLVNQRAEPVTMVARIEFSGELLEAEGDPVAVLHSQGVWGVNPRRQLTWTIELQPGESQTLKYAYQVLAPR